MGKRLASVAIATALMLLAVANADATQTNDLAGRYDFEAISAEGDAFTGTVLGAWTCRASQT